MVEPEEPLLDIGRITKPHGLRGDVIVAFLADRPERRRPGVTFDTDLGPVTIESVAGHEGRWIVGFDAIADRDAAERWRGVVLRAAPLDADDGTLWIHELVGCHVVDVAGTERGVIEAVQANPASDLLVLDSGALVPLRFVVGTPESGTVVVDVPDGLFELYDQ